MRLLMMSVVVMVILFASVAAASVELAVYEDGAAARRVSAPVGWKASWDDDGVTIVDRDGNASFELHRVAPPRGLNDDTLADLVAADLENPLIAGEKAPDGAVRYCAYGALADGRRAAICAQARVGKGKTPRYLLIGRVVAPMARYRELDGMSLMRASMSSAVGFTS